MNPREMSLWISPAASTAEVCRGNRPGAAFVLADGEEGDVPEQVVAGSNHAIEARLPQAEVGHEGGGVGRIELGDLELDLRADRHRTCRRTGHERFEARDPHRIVGLREVAFVKIEHEEQRLGGEELEAAQSLGFLR